MQTGFACIRHSSRVIVIVGIRNARRQASAYTERFRTGLDFLELHKIGALIQRAKVIQHKVIPVSFDYSDLFYFLIFLF